MNGNHFFPISVAKLVDWVNDLDTGIGHQNINIPKFLYQFIHASIYRVFIGHIHCNGNRFAACGFDCIHGCLRRIWVDICNTYRSACFGVGFCDIAADATCRASDECDFTG